MNAKKAKALRKQVGFVPSEERNYTKLKRGTKLEIGPDGKPQEIVVYQTLVNGARHAYQQVKRGRISL